MKDFYKILGVSADATIAEIKKAYRKQAFIYHPDQEGGSIEAMTLLNQAYEVLSNSSKRQDFDTERDVFDEEAEAETQTDLARLTTSAEPFSASFKHQHAAHVAKFTTEPLESGSITEYFASLTAQQVYDDTEGKDIFSYIQTQQEQGQAAVGFDGETEALDPSLACSLFRNFLLGRYHGQSLDKLVGYFAKQISDTNSAHQIFYKALQSIFLMAQANNPTPVKVLNALQQITYYAKNLGELPDYLVILFQDRYFRYLFQSTFDHYWREASTKVSPEMLRDFNNQEATTSFLNELKDKINSCNDRDVRRSLLTFSKYIKLLATFEEDIQQKNIDISKNYPVEPDTKPSFFTGSSRILSQPLRNPLIFDESEVTKKLKNVFSGINVLTDPKSSTQFGRHAVSADGNCGYTAFGITRNDAYQTLRNNLSQVRTLLQPAIKEVLLTEAFIKYLKDKELATSGLLTAFDNHQQAAQQGSNIDVTTQQLYRYANDLATLDAYLDYDIHDKRIDAGWSHPAILQALAHIQGIELYIWQPGTNQQVVPHDYYPHYNSGQVSDRIDLLFVNGNHFERLERLAPNSSQQTTSKNEGIHESQPNTLDLAIAYQRAEAYRNLAYHILDWLPVFSGKFDTSVITNIIMQTGLCFQLASQCDNQAARKMADEKLAEQIYCLAYSISQRDAPDIELNCSLRILSYLSAFCYRDSTLADIIKALLNRTRVLSDVFPFYEGPRANIASITQEEQLLVTMRLLLQNLVGWVVMNDTDIFAIELDHSDAVILYQAYEACVKKWYEKPYKAATENQLRLMLMATLLADRQWEFSQVNDTMRFSATTLQRTADNWLQPAPMLALTAAEPVYNLTSIDGMLINHKDGHLSLYGTPSDRNMPDCFRVLSQQDVYEVLNRNIQAAIFSLDPIDPTMPYHPFNTMFLQPSALYGTRFLQTLLAADYLLKLLTIGQEVQGGYPYQTRSIDNLTAYLPEYLKQVINDFQQAQSSESLHRFWIEAETVDVAFDDSKMDSDKLQKISLADVKMVVRKHKMVRDSSGQLVDAAEEHEGWHCYILNQQQKAAYDNGIPLPTIKEPALLLTRYSNTLRFLEDGKRSFFNLQNYNDQLSDLFEDCRSDEHGKVIENSEITAQLYRLSKEINKQTGKPHHYSPEYILAHELTRYYDELALYYPVFKRLKAFTQLTLLVRILNNVNENNNQNLANLREVLAQVRAWQRYVDVGGIAPKSTDVPFRETHQEIINKVRKSHPNQLTEWRSTYNYERIRQDKYNQLYDMRRGIGSLSFSAYSTEVDQACEQLVQENIRQHGYHLSSEIRAEINRNRSNIAEQLSSLKRSSCKEQLQSTFGPILTQRIGQRQLNQLIDDFLNQQCQPLANAWADYEYEQIKQQISEALLNAPIDTVARALQGSNAAQEELIAHVIKVQFKRTLAQETTTIQQRLSALEQLEREIKQTGFQPNSPDIELADKCLWVPASLKHNSPSVAGNRNTFFCYGGVSVQPNIRQVNQVWTSPQSRPLAQGGGYGGGTGGGSGGSGGSSSGGGGGGPGRPTHRDAMLRQAGFQNHHIVSPTNQHTKNHELLQLAGVNLDSRTNRIYLPTDPGLHPTRSLHSGKHVGEYSAQIGRRMDDIVSRGKMAGWGQQQYAQEFRGLTSEYRKELRAGNIALNCNQRPWSI